MFRPVVSAADCCQLYYNYLTLELDSKTLIISGSHLDGYDFPTFGEDNLCLSAAKRSLLIYIFSLV